MTAPEWEQRVTGGVYTEEESVLRFEPQPTRLRVEDREARGEAGRPLKYFGNPHIFYLSCTKS